MFIVAIVTLTEGTKNLVSSMQEFFNIEPYVTIAIL